MIQTLILGCNGLLGKEVSRNFLRRKDYVIGLDIQEKPELNFFNNYIQFDLLKIKDYHQIENLFIKLFNEKSEIINIVDCTLINKNKSYETILDIKFLAWDGFNTSFIS